MLAIKDKKYENCVDIKINIKREREREITHIKIIIKKFIKHKKIKIIVEE